MAWRQVRKPRSVQSNKLDGSDPEASAGDVADKAGYTCPENPLPQVGDCSVVGCQEESLSIGAVQVDVRESEQAPPFRNARAAKRPCLDTRKVDWTGTRTTSESDADLKKIDVRQTLVEVCIWTIVSALGSVPHFFERSTRQVWQVSDELGQAVFQHALPRINDLESFSQILHPAIDMLDLQRIRGQVPVADVLVCASIRSPNAQSLSLPSRTTDSDILPALTRLGGSPFVHLKELRLHGSLFVSGTSLGGLVKDAVALHTLSLVDCARLLIRDLRPVLTPLRRSLTSLDVSGCKALDKSLFDFLPSGLTRLRVRNCWRLCQGTLQPLVRKCALLEELDLSSDLPHAAALEPFAVLALSQLKQLQELDLTNQLGVGSAVLSKLRNSNPKLRLAMREAPGTNLPVSSHIHSAITGGNPRVAGTGLYESTC